MTQCVYCIGCIYYRRDEHEYCAHEGADECTDRKYFEMEIEDE